MPCLAVVSHGNVTTPACVLACAHLFYLHDCDLSVRDCPYRHDFFCVKQCIRVIMSASLRFMLTRIYSDRISCWLFVLSPFIECAVERFELCTDIGAMFWNPC